MSPSLPTSPRTLEIAAPPRGGNPRPAMPEEPASRRSFADLYRATVQPLRRYLSRMLHDPAEAEDVAHDAYLRVHPVTEAGRAEKPEALLYTTARRLALNRLKRRRIAPFVPGEAEPETHAAPTPDAAHQLMERQQRDRLAAAIAALPPGCRSVLVLRKVELLSHREIADRLGIAVSTVEKQYARALRLLRAELTTTADDGEFPAAQPSNPHGP